MLLNCGGSGGSAVAAIARAAARSGNSGLRTAALATEPGAGHFRFRPWDAGARAPWAGCRPLAVRPGRAPPVEREGGGRRGDFPGPRSAAAGQTGPPRPCVRPSVCPSGLTRLLCASLASETRPAAAVRSALETPGRPGLPRALREERRPGPGSPRPSGDTTPSAALLSPFSAPRAVQSFPPEVELRGKSLLRLKNLPVGCPEAKQRPRRASGTEPHPCSRASALRPAAARATGGPAHGASPDRAVGRAASPGKRISQNRRFPDNPFSE